MVSNQSLIKLIKSEEKPLDKINSYVTKYNKLKVVEVINLVIEELLLEVVPIEELLLEVVLIGTVLLEIVLEGAVLQ